MTDPTPSDDPILDLFLERLDGVQGEAEADMQVAEFSIRHPDRAAEFRRLATAGTSSAACVIPSDLAPTGSAA